MKPFVSIIIPCRNEEKFISKCLDSVISQDYPKDKLEVLVIDGHSEDKTREIINKFKIQLIENSRKYTPFALNIGIKNARGDIVMKMDAHTIYQQDYVSKCIFYLQKYNANNVGGVLRAISPKDNIQARGVAICLSHKFGMGNSYCKTGTEKIREVDTVAFGCFKKEVFKKIGLYDERMLRSQDLELNLRLKKAGGKIILAPDIIAFYYSKPTLRAFLKQNLIDGSWVIYPLKFGKMVFSFRHLIPFLFVLGLFFLIILSIFILSLFWLLGSIIILYLLISIYFSIKISIREKDFRFLFLMPSVFAIRHFGYGFGSIWGFFKILL